MLPKIQPNLDPKNILTHAKNFPAAQTVHNLSRRHQDPVKTTAENLIAGIPNLTVRLLQLFTNKSTELNNSQEIQLLY